jgi:acetate kinase
MFRRALAINCGSSSLKYALFEERKGDVALIERKGIAVIDHRRAVIDLLDDLRKRNIAPDVVGHRVVHGGEAFLQPTRVDHEMLAALDAVVPFAPLHLPIEIAAIRAVTERWPRVLQVACFDTAFHRSLPELARRLPLPKQALGPGVRRYGFHGLSYEAVVATLGKDLKPKTVIAHLGSGASMVAVRDGKSIDTTMGFTPSGGLVMGTRPGDLDPGVLVHLLRTGMSVDALERMLEHESGLLALSETTADFGTLLRSSDTDARAAFAVDAFCTSARKGVGALAAALGGIDSLIFTGGIGENAPLARAKIAHGLAHLGLELDDVKNAQNDEGVIGEGRCEIRMARTDEERVIACHSFALSAATRPKASLCEP